VPVSVALSLGGALVAIIVYVASGAGPANSANLVLVATTAFTSVAIISLFWIFFTHRDDPPAKFGRVAREHISTIAVSLMVGLIFTFVSLVEAFLGNAD
jgi:hypothetical protein